MTERKGLGTSVTDVALGIASRLPGLQRKRASRRVPGAPPGIEQAPDVDRPPAPGDVTVHCVDYGPERLESFAVDDLDAFLEGRRPAWATVRWIDVTGLHPHTINRLRRRFRFHTLAAEDVLHVPQRSKLETFDDHLFVCSHMQTFEDGRLRDEQVSFVLFGDLLITFQERRGDVWGPVRRRLELAGSRLRTSASGYLMYALLDAIVDHVFPILEHYGDTLEAIEDRLIENPSVAELHALYAVKRELGFIRRVMWPMRQVSDDLRRSEAAGMDESARTYLRDLHDHCLQVIEIVETYREMTGGQTELYMTSISNRMNEVMKVLTIMASLFIPITFVAGVYGMNFEHFPELGWRWSYLAFWLVCVSITAGLLVMFRRRGWLGSS